MRQQFLMLQFVLLFQVASQTELNEHGKRLEAALAAVRAELEHTQRVEEGAAHSEALCLNSNGCSQRTALFENGTQVLSLSYDIANVFPSDCLGHRFFLIKQQI